jgi:hypothetical protein
VRERSGYIVGNSNSGDFISVPEIGALVLTWLSQGLSIEECAERARDHAGEPVDVAGFLVQLDELGILPPVDAAESVEETAPTMRPLWIRLGRVLFSGAAWWFYSGATLAGIGILVTVPRVRPHYQDVMSTPSPLLSFLVNISIFTVLALLHEAAHFLAAAKLNVPSSISVGRRMYMIVFQTDLTRLWAVPRKARIGPLMAGMAWDATLLSAFLCVEAVASLPEESMASRLVRSTVLILLSGLLIQGAVYMRTDLYAVFSVATGCKNLWATKGGLIRRALGRLTPEDVAHLQAVDARELKWARVYLALYVPGVLYAIYYFAAFAVPGALHMISLGAVQANDSGLLSMAGAAGALSIVIIGASMGYGIWGVIRNGMRLLISAAKHRNAS